MLIIFPALLALAGAGMSFGINFVLKRSQEKTWWLLAAAALLLIIPDIFGFYDGFKIALNLGH